MNSKALNRLTVKHGKNLANAIEIINDMPTKGKALLMRRLFIVSLVAFWEAFHEGLCSEGLVYHPNPPAKAAKFIRFFHNPEPEKIIMLYRNVLGINNITESWWGNPLKKTGPTPTKFIKTIQEMVNFRHDIAHGIWKLSLSSKDCDDFLHAVLFLAVRTEEKVHTHFQRSKRKTPKQGAES